MRALSLKLSAYRPYLKFSTLVAKIARDLDSRPLFQESGLGTAKSWYQDILR